jgi:hypothetical protein
MKLTPTPYAPLGLEISVSFTRTFGFFPNFFGGGGDKNDFHIQNHLSENNFPPNHIVGEFSAQTKSVGI